MHGEIQIFDAVIMFAQANESWSEKSAGMYIYLEEVNHVYSKAMSGGFLIKKTMAARQALKTRLEINGGL
jgi:uncharacterized glyoxalase superfamily protein PhnB